MAPTADSVKSSESTTQQQAGAHTITPELVREVTAKVYALLLQEARLDRTRRGDGGIFATFDRRGR